MVRRHKRHLSQPGRKNHHLMELIKDFFENTSFSGLRYIFEPGRMIIERIFWIVMAAVSTAALLVVIAFLWTKFQNDPTIISLDTDSMMFNHPYMAFLICPLELRPYNDTNKLINSDWIRRINNDKLLEMSLLGAVLTDSGLCWTFNSIAHSNFKDTTRDNKWNLEGGGNKYITMPGSKNVKISIAVYFFNHNVPLKFKTYILAPWEVPEPTDTAWFSSGLNGMRFDHQSMTTICTSDVRNLPIRRRGCLFMDENIASAVSPVYSQKAL
uniref:Uncharacterized protein n=1 Tax=Timema cristinae TaxID=61476 RepID=A0A7R9GQM7_TIMCR|nr:unnamed protein product [Timema cristinae]